MMRHRGDWRSDWLENRGLAHGSAAAGVANMDAIVVLHASGI